MASRTSIITWRQRKRGESNSTPHAGAALLIAMTVICLVSMFAVHVLDCTLLELSSLRNSIEYERALYLANAGVHAAAAELEASSSWRGVVADGTFPADDTYTASAVDGAVPHTVIVTSQGAAGSVIRTVVATMQL